METGDVGDGSVVLLVGADEDAVGMDDGDGETKKKSNSARCVEGLILSRSLISARVDWRLLREKGELSLVALGQAALGGRVLNIRASTLRSTDSYSRLRAEYNSSADCECCVRLVADGSGFSTKTERRMDEWELRSRG